jgi:hypothetical protein
VDSTGSAYVTGRTGSANFPTTAGAFQTTPTSLYDAFVTKINPAGSALVYSTYLGGSDVTAADGIAVDGSGNAYISGFTGAGFPTTAGALQTNYAGNGDAFVTKLNAAGSGLIYSTYLGGTGTDGDGSNPWVRGIAVDSSGNAHITGSTNSTDFPTTAGVFQRTYGGGQWDAFVAELNADASALVYSTYLGGSNYDQPGAIAVDGTGNTYVTGTTSSTNFPTQNALKSNLSGSEDAFVTKISLS